jgi:N-methylhydantoinase A
VSRLQLLGIDTGGTFTDFLMVDGERIDIFKVLSTPSDPSRAVIEGLAEARRRLGAAPTGVVHGFTVATNALLTRRGARAVLVTTGGFEDLLTIGRQERPDLYALVPEAPEPLIPPRRVVGVSERLGPSGRVERALTDTEVKRVARAVARLDPEAVAICLLHSYADPRHERKLAAAIKKAVPAGTPISVSSQVSREYREFERASTTAVNAYLSPIVREYLDRLSRAVGPSLRVMQSNGGAVPPRAVVERPVLSVLSGPAGGVLGAAEIGRRAGLPRVITLDVGGTSTDVAVVPGELRTSKETVIGGNPLRIPMLELETVGAGGGSLARADRGGALVVGPESAGADPGPACYGRNGGPTVTDAHVVLGRIVPHLFAGGSMQLDTDAAWRVMADLGKDLGFRERGGAKANARRAARGVIEVANATIEHALRVVSVARGHDVRRFALFAFGGAGALHVAELGRSLGVREIVVPPRAGVLSAWGLLVADEVHPYSMTVLWRLDTAVVTRAEKIFAELEGQAQRQWGAGLSFRRSADLRYAGQSFEIEVPWSKRVDSTFHRAHAERYGYCREGQPIEIVNLNLEARRPGPKLPENKVSGSRKAVAVETIQLDTSSAVKRSSVYERETMGPGARIKGPALIVEYGATTYLPAAFDLRVDGQGNLRITYR